MLIKKSLKNIKLGKKSFMGRIFEGTLRKTYLIDKKGNIIKVYENVNPLIHPQEILRDLESNTSLE